MSASGSAEGPSDGVRVYHVHTPLPKQDSKMGTNLPVYTSGEGSQDTDLGSGEIKHGFVSHDSSLGFCPGMTTCPTCQQDVMTEVTYKIGKFAWIIAGLIFFLGLFTMGAAWALFLIPFCTKRCKDAYHTCPSCIRVLHIEERKCCKRKE